MTQDTLFPIADLKTEGYAQPEPRGDETGSGQQAEVVEDGDGQ